MEKIKLCESSDFKDAIKATKDYLGYPQLTEQFIEKDYYVTEVLRIVAEGYKDCIVFKGGTSLSKAWNIIERFSEDVDLYLNPEAHNHSLSNAQIDRKLREVRDEVARHPHLKLLSTAEGGRNRSSHGLSRTCDFAYIPSFSGNQEIPSRILLEMGIRSGNFPIEQKELSSLLARFLKETEQSLNACDEDPFSINILHFCRTFVEKLFAIHSDVIKAQLNNSSIETKARHYYDIFCLSQQKEILEMLNDSERYQVIKQDCVSICKQFFSNSFHPPEGLSFANSEALFPVGDTRQMIIGAYTRQCENLCYGEYPRWEEVEARFNTLREML